MLLNSIRNFALEHKLSQIYSPTSTFAMKHTNPLRTMQPGTL